MAETSGWRLSRPKSFPYRPSKPALRPPHAEWLVRGLGDNGANVPVLLGDGSSYVVGWHGGAGNALGPNGEIPITQGNAGRRTVDPQAPGGRNDRVECGGGR